MCSHVIAKGSALKCNSGLVIQSYIFVELKSKIWSEIVHKKEEHFTCPAIFILNYSKYKQKPLSVLKICFLFVLCATGTNLKWLYRLPIQISRSKRLFYSSSFQARTVSPFSSPSLDRQLAACCFSCQKRVGSSQARCTLFLCTFFFKWHQHRGLSNYK